MTALEQLRAEQHNDRIVPSDVDLGDFLQAMTIKRALADYELTTATERAMLAHARSAS